MSRPSKYLNEINIGQQFGRWIVYDAIISQSNRTKVAVQCECGTKAHVSAYDLVKKRSTQCQNCARGTSPTLAAVNAKASRAAGRKGMMYSLSPQSISASLSIQSGTCALTGQKLTPGVAHVACFDNALGMTPDNTVLVSNDAKALLGKCDVRTLINFCHTVVNNNPVPPKPTRRVSTQDFFNRREASEQPSNK